MSSSSSKSRRRSAAHAAADATPDLGTERIQVSVRLRPLEKDTESAVGLVTGTILSMRPTAVRSVTPGGTEREQSERTFEFDTIFDENATQENVFSQIGLPILQVRSPCEAPPPASFWLDVPSVPVVRMCLRVTTAP